MMDGAANVAGAHPEGGEFWKDIPDDILEELYKQLKCVFLGALCAFDHNLLTLVLLFR